MPRRPSPGNITDRYGWRIHPISKQRQFHEGLDIGWVGGRTLVAPESGRVVGYGWRGGWGQRLDFQGDSGTLHYLAHTERSLVNVGQRVTEGSALAVMGQTGNATGIHVHWETRPGGGATIDPEQWLASQNAPAGGGGTPLEDDMAVEDLYTHFQRTGGQHVPVGEVQNLHINDDRHVSVARGPAKHVTGNLAFRLQGGEPYGAAVQVTPFVVTVREGKEVSRTSLRARETVFTGGDTFGEVAVNCALQADQRLSFRIGGAAVDFTVVDAVFRGMKIT